MTDESLFIDPGATGGYVGSGEDAEKPGDRIGVFKLLQRIGEGGMGSVWMAEQTDPVRRMVALKVIKAGMDSKQVLARFEAERQALALMDHPNIAKVLDAGTTETGRPYFVMELVKGVPITTFCDEHQSTPRQRLKLFVAVCSAIQHAHTKGVIHRDVKPSNVLVAPYDDTPVVKVIDFGIAKATAGALTDATLFTQFGSIVGTLEYMSPEQAKLNALDIDTRSDVYSLGVLLYELLTGTTPFDRERLRTSALDECLRLIREEDPPRPSVRLSGATLPAAAQKRGTEPAKLAGLVRGELDWIAMKALEKDRTRRYESPAALARDVERHLAGEPVEACPPTWRYRAGKFVRKHRAALTTGSLLAVALGVGVSLTIWQALRASRAERDAEEQARQLRDERRQKAFHRALETAFGGHLGQAEQAIAEAGRLGIDAGRIAVLRGVLYLQRGEIDRASDEARLAVEFAPESVAALALLGMCDVEGGRSTSRYRIHGRLRERRPLTAEDHLLYGAFLLLIAPEEGIPLLEEATRRSLRLGHAFLARLRAWQAYQSIPGGDLEPALNDLAAARAQFPDNALVEQISAEVYMYAAIQAGEQGKLALSEEMWAKAGRAVEWMEKGPMTDLGDSVARTYHIERFGTAAALEHARRHKDRRLPWWLLYRAGRIEEARQQLNKGGAWLVPLMAEEKNDGPEKAFRYWRKLRGQDANVIQRIMMIELLYLLKRPEEARAEAKQLLGDPIYLDLRKTADPPVRFLAGLLTEEELRQAPLRTRWEACTAEYEIGLVRLSRSDRAGAIEAFERAAATRSLLAATYNMSRVFLEKLQADEKWPHWIFNVSEDKGMR